MNSKIFTALTLVFVSLVSLKAQATTTRFSIVSPMATDKDDWFFTPSSAHLKHREFRISHFMNYAYHPLELSTPTTRTGIVDHFFVQQWGLAYGLCDKLTLEMNLPIVLWNRFIDPTSGAVSNSAKLSDLNFQARYNVIDKEMKGWGLSLISFFGVPTGSDSTYMGDPRPTGGVRVVADKDLGAHVTVGMNLGTRFREKIIFHNLETSSQFLAGAGAAVKLGKGFLAKTEITSATPFTNFYAEQVSTPTEWFMGVNKSFSNGVDLSVGTGLALVRAAGTPLSQVFMGLSYTGAGRSEKISVASKESREWSIQFRKKSATLSPEAKTQLDQASASLRSSKRPQTIILAGDAYGKHTNRLTKPLFQKRVKKIQEYFEGAGLKNVQFDVQSLKSDSELNFRRITVKIP